MTSDKVVGGITIGPLINVYAKIGNPKAKQISKILLPKALEIASSYSPFKASLYDKIVSGRLVAADARITAIK